MKFTQDTSKLRTFSPGAIKQTGFYPCTITKAYENQSASSLSQSIRFEVVADTGQIGRFDLWVIGKDGGSTDKNGNPLSALTDVNDLMVLLNIKDLQSKPGKVSIYDFDLKQDVEQRKMVFAGLIDQSIGIIFEMRDNTYNGKTTQRAEFAGFFDAETKQSAYEYVNNEDAVACDNRLKLLLEDNHINKQANSQPNAPQNSAPVDPYNIDDDDTQF